MRQPTDAHFSRRNVWGLSQYNRGNCKPLFVPGGSAVQILVALEAGRCRVGTGGCWTTTVTVVNPWPISPTQVSRCKAARAVAIAS